MNMLYLSIAILVLVGASSALDLSGCAPDQPKIINALLYGLEGDIYSPGYKEGVNYPDNILCQYTIQAPFGFKVRLSFVDLDIDVLDLCSADSLVVFEGQSPMNPSHGVFCGNGTYPDVLSLANALHLVFRSDFMRNGKGFHLHYRVSIPQTLCGMNKGICRNRNCFNASSRCNGKDDCGDGTDEENCGFPLPTTTCGKRLNETLPKMSRDRIVGGNEAIPGSWPWQADLQLALFNPNGHMCGGTLINAQWVVTATHCFLQNPNPLEWRVHFGNHRKFYKDRFEQVRFVVNIIGYPDLTGPQISEQNFDITQDLALMKLNAPVTFNEWVRPACLPTQDYKLKTDMNCMASGWGSTRGSGSSSALKEVELTIEEDKTCNKSVAGPMNPKTMICVSNRKGFHDVCHGDSGGPLVCKVNGEWQVMGATSHGTAHSFQSGLCGLPGSYTVYSKVSDKIKWIQDTINKYS